MKKTLLFILILILSPFIFSQNGENDPTFNPFDLGFGIGDGFSGEIHASAIQSDNKLIAGGGFSMYNGIERYTLARLNPDGSIDSSFVVGTGFNDVVNSIALQSNGKIIAGGGFTSYNGNACNNIARLNADGTFDTSFNLGSGFNSSMTGVPVPLWIEAIAIQNDDKIIASGRFDEYNGIPVTVIVRLNPDGTLDNSFDPGPQINGEFSSIVIQNNGKIAVGGNCWSCNGTSINHILRLNSDGSMDSSFNPGIGFNSSINTLKLQNDGKIVAGGIFLAFNGNSAKYVARLNTNGSLDTSFDSGSLINNFVYSLAIQSDQKIVIGGKFTFQNGNGTNRVVRLNSDGSKDNSFDVGSGFDNRVYTVSIQNDGKVIAGGNFISYNGTTQNRIARLNTDGSLDNNYNLGTGFNNRVNSIAIQNDGKIIGGGLFTSFNGSVLKRVVRLNTDGLKDSSFDTGSGFSGYARRVNSVAMQNDGKVLVGGGLLDIYNGSSINCLVRLKTDGALDTSFDMGVGISGPSEEIHSIKVQNDDKIIVGGSFDSFNGTPRNSIVRINADGSIDNSFDPGSGFGYGRVFDIVIQTDGKMLIGGYFNSFNGEPSSNVVRLNADGSFDYTFDIGSGFNERVNTIKVQNDGKILVGGSFTTFNDNAVKGIIRLNSDGTQDQSFDSGSGLNGARSIVIQNNGKIIVGGVFNSYNGVARSNIVRLHNNGSIDESFEIGTGFDKPVFSLAFQDNDKLIVGGDFLSYNGIGRNRIARLITGCVDASVNVNWSVLTANNSDATYQWVDCNNNYAPIVNETSQVFNVTQDGDYAVIVSSNTTNCVDTSTCINIANASVNNNFNESSLKLYPNPNNGSFTIDIDREAEVAVYNSVGRKILTKQLKIGQNSINFENIANGIYYLNIADKLGGRNSHRISVMQ
ncbi:T9SS type A sorting domain-containing protein [Brumimicrobium oceani]|uniref:Secretion system C-terminal sorting domain-containing protein n=1 Tax=Brumimicrobium oceani TaxID=2100725 RepID=A0A2U2XE96_9FLAO|nr:T9SS type A sorting domain-containing protein [Brumimicrobium oceani]PWH86060.1 hypothetical protein DIT68_05755 [Brumimicrobium oceani]